MIEHIFYSEVSSLFCFTSYQRLSQMDLTEDKSFEEGIDDICLLSDTNISVAPIPSATTDQVLVSVLHDDKTS